MPVKLIGTIILLILVTIFAGVNLDNKCDITFIFYTFKDVPVFMTVIISFAIGAILVMPFTMGKKKNKKNGPVNSSENSKPKEAPSTESKTLFDFKIKREASSEEIKKNGEKKSLFGGKKNASKADSKSSDSADAESTGAPV